MSDKLYCIFWRSKESAVTGRSTLKYDKDFAESLAEEMNEKYPQIKHEAVPEDAPDPKVVVEKIPEPIDPLIPIVGTATSYDEIEED